MSDKPAENVEKKEDPKVEESSVEEEAGCLWFSELFFFALEIAMFVLFLTVTDYTDIGMSGTSKTPEQELQIREFMQTFYPMWQDLHVMIYIGFGFLMVFLKTSSWTAVGFNYMLAAFAFQWGILVVGFWDQVWSDEWQSIPLGVNALVTGDFAACACMITFGALLGKVDLFQAAIVVFFEVIFYGLNRAICLHTFFAKDVGGSMYIHTFAAFFGLGASYFLQSNKAREQHEARAVGGYMSTVVAMGGTIFLYLYWPSFNAVFAAPENHIRIIVNTALAISASCIGAFTLARLVAMKCDMEIAINATLAGGVAIGACCDSLLSPGIAIGIGAFAGVVSAYCRAYINLHKWGLHDTCGVFTVHGIPGVIGAIASAITTANADLTFPKVPGADLTTVFGGWMIDRQYTFQGACQIFALLVSIAIGFLTGAFSGLLASWVGRTPKLLFEDGEHWHGAEYEAPYVNKVYNRVDTPEKATEQH